MTITRAQILANSLLYFGQIQYSQSKLWSDGYRQDCSGYVSRCWGAAKSGPGTWGGYSTTTFVTHGIMVEIPWSELRPGDAIGRCGPGTDSSGNGNGHIMLWLGKEGSRHRIRDHGSGVGPKERLVTPPSDYRAFRFVGVEGMDIEIGDLKPDQFPLQPGHYFGNIAGPNESHGGGVSADIPYIRAIQQRLNDLGFAAGVVDGEFGPATEAAVRNFQGSRSIEVDGKVGPVTWGQLFGPVPQPPTPPTEPPDPSDMSILLRIESKIDALLAKPPVVAQIDTSSVAQMVVDLLMEQDIDMSPEEITEAVKEAFREGTGP